MITTLLSNLMDFVLSVPINLVIIGIICLILKIAGKTIKTIIKVFVGYFIICFILAVLGLSLPSIPALVIWLKNIIISIGAWLSSLGIL